MSTQPSMFKTSEGQARYFAAYDATLALWPVSVESFDVPTRFGSTHVHTCGPQDAPPLLLLPGQAVSSTMWYPNIGALSHAYRVYAPDIIGDMGKSVRTALNRATNLIPHIETALIPDAGHALNFDQPEMVNTRILEFLREQVSWPEGSATR